MKKYGSLLLFLLVFIILAYLLYSQAQLSAQVEDLKNETVSLRNKVADFESKLNVLRTELTVWENNLAGTTSQLNTRMADLEGEIS